MVLSCHPTSHSFSPQKERIGMARRAAPLKGPSQVAIVAVIEGSGGEPGRVAHRRLCNVLFLVIRPTLTRSLFLSRHPPWLLNTLVLRRMTCSQFSIPGSRNLPYYFLPIFTGFSAKYTRPQTSMALFSHHRHEHASDCAHTHGISYLIEL